MATNLIFKANRGVIISKMLWPELTLEPEGSFWDRYGIDGYLGEWSVQIKYDRRIATSGNIYHEYYEKSANNPNQLWRKSPGVATSYIFTTETDILLIGYLVYINELAKAEVDKKLTMIIPNNGFATSIGILIPLSELKTECRRTRIARG